MLFRMRDSHHMVDVHNIVDLINVYCEDVEGQYQEGEEQQDPARIHKHELVFLSGEELPRCWTDPHYRDNELARQSK